MRLPTFTEAARYGRSALRNLSFALRAKARRPVPGRFQPYNHTLPDRYPWLFQFAATRLEDRQCPSLLSFGCSLGEEPLSLRHYFPTAQIRGLDIDPKNIAVCVQRMRQERATEMSFAVAANTLGEPSESYDAIFCLAVLCHGDLTVSKAQRCDPYLHFDRFEALVIDFARCLKPRGLLFLHEAGFRFSDTTVAGSFDTVLEASPEHLTALAVFDRHNKLIPGPRYPAVGFQKR